MLGLRIFLTVATMLSLASACEQDHNASPQAKLLEYAQVYIDDHGMRADRPMPWKGTMYFGDPDDPKSWISVDEDDRLLEQGKAPERAKLSSKLGKEGFRSLVAVDAAWWQTFAHTNQSLLKAIPTIRGYDARETSVYADVYLGDGPPAPDRPVKAEVYSLVDSLPQLTRLDLGGFALTNRDVEKITSLQNLTHLYLDDNRWLTDEAVEVIVRRLPSLQELMIRRSNTTSKSLTQLAKLGKLKLLACSYPVRGEGNAAGLEQLSHLSALCVRSSEFNDATLKELSNWRELEELNLDKTSATGEGLRHLPEPSRLRILWLDGNFVSAQGLKEIGRFQNLRWLSLSNCKQSAVEVKQLLKQLPELRLLNLEGASVDRELMKTIGGLMHLQGLCLDATAVRDEDIPSLLKLKDLRYLSMVDTDASVKSLQTLRGLEKLWWLPLNSRGERLEREMLDRGFPNHTIQAHQPFWWEFQRSIARPYNHPVKFDLN